MIDAALLPVQRRLLEPPARLCVACGIGANAVTLAGFGLGLACVLALALKAWPLALALLAANRVADGLDGAIARLTRPTRRGAFLDIAMDFMFYALVPVGFALADPGANALPAAVLIAAFVGTGSSFLAFASVAAEQGMTAPDYPTKGIYYLGGLTEGAETIAIFALMGLFPAHFPVLAYGFAAACALTTLLRWRQGWIAFAPVPTDTTD